MVTKHRTAAEQKLWDEVVKNIVAVCIEFRGVDGCAHLVREIADAVVLERRRSQQEQSH
jgi:hypothetical protein